MKGYKMEVVLFLLLVVSSVGMIVFSLERSNSKAIEKHLDRLVFCVRE